MTLKEVMKKYNGTWEAGRATIMDQGGYYWVIATGSEKEYVLTRDGLRYVTESEPEKQLANMSADVVVSKPKSRVKVDKNVSAAPADDLDLDGI